MRTDIVNAAKFRYNQNVSIDERTKNLYGDIQNVPSHVFGEHAECARLEYFCDGKNKENEKNIVPDLLKIGVYQDVKEILRPLLAHAESLLYNTTNNAVESLNGLIAKYTGGKRLNFTERGSYTGRCAAAVVEYNSNQVHSRLDAVMKKKTPEVVRQIEEKKKKEKEKRAAKQKETKAARYVRKQLPSQKDSDYGQNAQKPNMPSEMYELEREKHMQMLSEWQDKRHAIEEETIGQAKNRRWLQYRSKLLTASNFGQVCRRRPDTFCANAVKSFLYPKIISAPAVEYGKECEKIARELHPLLRSFTEWYHRSRGYCRRPNPPSPPIDPRSPIRMEDASDPSGRPSFGCPYAPANRRLSSSPSSSGGGNSVEARFSVTHRGPHVGRESRLYSGDRENNP
ncbi:uncharacterized protein LOC143367264 [Andrena cerasifolii]|uniref:uncharacterized protein LOC143367264 n=1 Tax=Andrena cerasifolii TaxID=2819439 RepID=UPI004037C2AC